MRTLLRAATIVFLAAAVGCDHGVSGPPRPPSRRRSGTFAISTAVFAGGSTYSSGTFDGSYLPGSLGGRLSKGAASGTGTLVQTADFATGLPAVQLTVQGSF